jgi:diguanylate cyclase (GGDEF)-like protein
VREQDKIGRWGGEEFLILFTETREAEAVELMELIREKAAAFELEWEGQCISGLITLSAGITELLPSDEQVDQVIERADQALYLAKDRGKNRVVVSQEPSS